jgi:3-oxoacyl-[acyl-carrier protein] reductase
MTARSRKSSAGSRRRPLDCLITGGSSGIGTQFARMLVKRGYRLVLVGRDTSRLNRLFGGKAALRTRGAMQSNVVFPADLSVAGEGRRVADEILASKIVPAIVVHCAGGSLGVKDPLAPEDDFRRVWEVNAHQLICINRQLIPCMRARKFGRILHMTSVSAEKGLSSIAYTAAKSYLNAYVRSAGRQFARDGVLINAISTSAIAAVGNNWSRAVAQNSKSLSLQLRHGQSIPRIGRAEDLEEIAMFLVSNRNHFTTGSILSVDGGAS